MSNLPLQDGYETQLSQAWDGNTGTINVLSTPVYTPKTTPTIITVNPGKTNAQLAIITDYDPSAKTLTVTTVTGLYKALGVLSTVQTHSAGSKVIISDNYEFWKDLATRTDNQTFTGTMTFSGDVVSSKSLKIPFYATAVARDAAIPSPTDSMICYVNDVEEFYGYKNGAWQTLGSGGGGSAVWYQDSTGDGTITGAINGVNTSYVLSQTPGSVDAVMVSYNGQVLERGAGDDYTLVGNTITMNWAPVSGKITAMYPSVGVGTQNATTRSTTNASSVNGELYRSSDDSNSLYYKDNAGDAVKLLDVTSNKIPVSSVDLTGANVTAYVDAASDTVAGKVEMATDAEVEAGTDTTRYVTPSQIDRFSVGTQLQNTFKTFQIHTAGFLDTNEAAGWIGSTQTGSLSSAAGFAMVNTSAAGNGIVYSVLPGTGSQDYYRYSDGKDLRVKFNCKFEAGGGIQVIGLHTTTTGSLLGSAETNTTDGNIRICKNSTNDVYACVSNGSSYTATLITGITYTNWNTYEIITNPGTDVKFYVNNVLKATITTNIPTTASSVNFGISNGSGALTRFGQVVISIEN